MEGRILCYVKISMSYRRTISQSQSEKEEDPCADIIGAETKKRSGRLLVDERF